MEELVAKYRRKGVLLDANLLLGLLIGSLDARQLEICRARTKYFGPEDLPLLRQFLAQFGQIITTPHILTEVSNLAGNRLKDPLRTMFYSQFREWIARSSEKFEPAQTISAHDNFLRFGLTDTAISMASIGHRLVLTDDARLVDLLGRQGMDVVNFNHIRVGSWGK